MPAIRRVRFVPTAIFLLLASVGLSGCASAVIGVGTAAVAASTTEKGFSTSVADTQIHAKLTDQILSQRQQQRITKAASLFLAKNPTFKTFDCQFDFIIMQAEHSFGIGKITHNHNAW